MKVLKTILSFIFLSFLCTIVSAQSRPLNPGLTDVAPPSPSAGALGKFGSIPVGPSTGIPEVGIPVYTHEDKNSGIGLAVSLSYHAGGVRVDEIASTVGIGWSLNAGGVITRTMRGIPDERLMGFLSSPNLPEYEYQGNHPGQDPYSRPFNQIYNNQMDCQNDIFSFNFNGRSGRFVYGKNGDMSILTQQRLQISKQTVNQVITTFEITDEEGRKFVFSDYETTSMLSSGYAILNGFSSSWYLSKIISASGQDSIMFQYEGATIFSYNLSKSYSQVWNMRQGGPPYSSSAPTITQGHEIKRLKKITFPDGVTVDFTYDASNRTDHPDKALKEIRVTDGINTRGVKLTQDYSLGRLTLLKATPFTPEGGDEEPFEMEYIVGLPERLSTTQDHWGFANSNTSSMIPEEYISERTWIGGDRSTSPMGVKAGSLRKMTYPTGGYTIFDMEANSAQNYWLENSSVSITPQLYVGGLRAKKIEDYDGVSTEPVMIKEYQYVLEDGVTTSGTLGTYPVYSNPVFYMFRTSNFMPPDYVEYYQTSEPNALLRSSSSIYDLCYVNGSPVTYSRVVELHKGKSGQSNGKIVRMFTSYGSSGPYIPTGFPFTPPYNYTWTYGLLTKELVYDSANALIRETRNEYDYVDEYYNQTPGRYENFRSIAIAPVKFIVNDIFNPTLGGDPVYFVMNSFSPVAGRTDLVKTTVLDYSAGGTTLVQEKGFLYDQVNNYLIADTTRNSKGEVVINRYRRPKEMISEGRDVSGVYQAMVSKNMTSQVVETETLRNNAPLSLMRENYFSFYPNVLKPQTIVVKNGSYPEDVAVRHHAYDVKGNVLSASKENDVRMSYIWDSKTHFANAIVKNATDQEIAYTSFETDAKGNWNNYTGTITTAAASALPPTGKKYYNLSTGNDLSKTVTIGKKYVISYWRNSATPFSVSGGSSVYKAGATINGWTYHEHTVIASSSSVVIAGAGAIDEVRLYPEGAAMTTYTYQPLCGVTTQCDQNNRITYYEYDHLSRLKQIRDQYRNILKKYCYNLSGQVENCL